MADDPYMAGREPGEPIEVYQRRIAKEAEDLGITVEQLQERIRVETGYVPPEA